MVKSSTLISGSKARDHRDIIGVAWCPNELPNGGKPNN
jgi:hypothetical protein